ncbi:MAG: NosD domain-containing protein [Dermatophilaceae bacterium]
MSRRRLGVLSGTAVAGSALLLSVGPAVASGSAGSKTVAVATAQCSPAPAAAGIGKEGSGVALGGMAGIDESSSPHSTQELRNQLARTPAGGTLTVQPGIYKGSLIIDRPVTIVGIGHPIIRGEGIGTVLTIRAAGTTVRDLMIEGSGPGPVDNPAGVRVQADRVVLKNLHLRDIYTGVWVEGVKDAQVIGNVIEGRTSVAVSGQSPTPMKEDMAGMDMAGMVMSAGKGGASAARGDGVSLFNAIRPVVTGNAISDVRDGIYLEYGGNTRIDCNIVLRGRYAIHSMYQKSVSVARNHFAGNESGPVMMYGGPVTLEGNVIRDEQSPATGFGALFLDVGGVTLLRNVMVSNRVGLQIEGPLDDPRPTKVELNTIALNQIGVGLYPTANASLSQNSLVENTVQVLGLGPQGSGGKSPWSSKGVGNYWSNYRGYERPGSGVGAIPHVEGAAAGRLLAGDPNLLALASSPAFTLLRAVEQRTAGQHPVSVDRFPIIDPRSPSLPATTVHTSLRTGLVGATSLAFCSLTLLRSTRRRPIHRRRTRS